MFHKQNESNTEYPNQSRLRELLDPRKRRNSLIRVQSAFVPPSELVQRERRRREPEEVHEVARLKTLRQEDFLHEGHVDERELRAERRKDGGQQQSVLEDAAAEPAVLEC